jgi:dynein regulatory complex protein 1
MLSKVQITASRTAVDAALEAGSTALSDVMLEREHAESVRRRREAALRDERYERISRELAESARTNSEIESRWDEVARHSIPQELYAAISAQYKEASALLAGKDDLIRFLQVQLRHGDEEYVELLSQHQEDVNAALKRMSSNFHSFLATVKAELNSIEETFMRERSELLERNKDEIESLLEKRRKLELALMESRQAREKRYATELAEIRSRDAEDYTALKIDLENSIQLFEQQLEEMRATYQLNAEKLEYNHAVLVERDLENRATVEHHRQRLRRLKESLSALISRFHKSDAKYRGENATLTEEYKRITESFKDLQRKYAHFVCVDTKRYADVWDMNEEHVMQMVHKLLRADQIVHGQVLGVAWRPPLLPADLAAVTLAPMGGAAAAGAGAQGEVDIDAITSAHIFAAGQYATLQAAQQASAQAAAAAAAADNGASAAPGSPNNNGIKPSSDPLSATAAASAAAASASAAAPPTGSRFTPGQIKSVLDLLGREVSFLLDSRIQETVAAVAEKNGSAGSGSDAAADREAEMYKADGIMAAIGVEDREDLDSLVSVFFEGGGTSAGEAGSGPAGGATSDRPSVHPNDVAKIIKEFVLKRQQVKTKGGAAAGGGGGSALAALLAQAGADENAATGGAVVLKQNDLVLSEKKSRRKERERLFWHYLGHGVVSSHTASVWSALEQWMVGYNTLLEERATLIDETTELARQNEELKLLLSEYLGSKVNQELEIPPTRLIRVNNQQQQR